ATGVPSESKKPKLNLGGSSRLLWVNVLAQDPRLSGCRQNLFQKIGKTRVVAGGCVHVVDFTENTRPVLDKAFQGAFRAAASDAPERFSPYTIALVRAGKLVPAIIAPSYPPSLRKVLHKRTKSSKVDEQEATWVASHLCHDRRCINDSHLVWEPSWMNRLRDNCPGGEACVHGPDKCLRPHRPSEEQVDWTDFLSEADRALYWADRFGDVFQDDAGMAQELDG
ncbi:MAG: hypothetical protein Q9224_006200, partial [Gallowayella concinna]